jgi:hypothetical protein
MFINAAQGDLLENRNEKNIEEIILLFQCLLTEIQKWYQ